MPKLLLIFALCCGVTCLIELIPLLFTKKRKQWITASLINNVVTNPIINTLILLETLFKYDFYPDIFDTWYRNSGFTVNPYYYAHIAFVIILELAVVIFEAWIYHRLVGASWKKCLLISAALNILSFLIGTKLEPLFQISLGSEFYNWLVR